MRYDVMDCVGFVVVCVKCRMSLISHELLVTYIQAQTSDGGNAY